jgi:hypothetical protein
MAVPWLLLVSACAGGDGGPSPTEPHDVTTTTVPSTTTITVTMEEGLAGYRSCLADEGISIGPISIDGLGRPRMADTLSRLDLTDRAVLDALEECGRHLSSGALDLTPDPELRALVQSRLEELAECIRTRGVADYPDPVPDFDGIGSPFPPNRIPWTDPQLPAAMAACTADLGPTPG